MTFLEVFVVGVGLSMDAFAVALCKGLSMRKWNTRYGFIIAGAFGLFQALMPLLGWLAGMSFYRYIEAFDHWIAFALLLIVGGKMVYDAVKELRHPEEDEEPAFSLRVGELLVLSIATSIDALAVGLSFAMLGMQAGASAAGGMGIWTSILTIGVTTFLLSYAGAFIGKQFGTRLKAKAELVGGIVLIALGIKILLEHLLA